MITVAIPAYKSSYLLEAIESVLKQSYQNFELIILDDGSPDNLSKLVSQFKDERIRFYKNEENIGNIDLIKTWNRCLELARGEYFVLFSDDDVYQPDFLKEMVELADKYPNTNLFHCRIQEINDSGDTITFSPVCPEWENVYSFIWHRIKLYRIQFAPDFMCRTEELKRIGGFINFPLGWGSDDATWFTLSKDFGVCYTQKVLFKWRNSSINISKTGDYKKRFEAVKLYSKWLKNFVEKLDYKCDEDKNLCNEIKKEIYNWHDLSIRAILIKRLNNNYSDMIKLFFIWLRFRKKYSFNFQTFLKTLLSLLKYRIEL